MPFFSKTHGHWYLHPPTTVPVYLYVILYIDYFTVYDKVVDEKTEVWLTKRYTNKVYKWTIDNWHHKTHGIDTLVIKVKKEKKNDHSYEHHLWIYLHNVQKNVLWTKGSSRWIQFLILEIRKTNKGGGGIGVISDNLPSKGTGEWSKWYVLS